MSLRSCLLGLVLATVIGLVFVHSIALRPEAAAPVAAGPAPATPALSAQAVAAPRRPVAPAVEPLVEPAVEPSVEPVVEAPRSSRSSAERVHVVFSTDCSGYQHWQGIALWYASRAAGQRGPVTRITSGCDDAQRSAIEAEWRAIDATGDFRAHFAPKGELKGNYKYSNKPNGLFHWLNHAEIAEEVVILIDPDMLLVKPLTVDLADTLRRLPRNSRKQYEFVDEAGVGVVLSAFEDVAPRVARGRPAGQHFGIGGVWARAGTPAARPAWVDFDKAAVCGARGPCVSTSPAEADGSFAVGPVYAAHVDDWRVIARGWVDAMPKVHAQYPHLLAEMYALTMAAANATTPWSLVSSFMVSDPKTMSPTEAWTWVDRLATEGGPGAVCRGADATTWPLATRDRAKVALPRTLHYCQKYELAGHFFGKRKVPHDLFRCDRAHLDLDVAALLAVLDHPTKLPTTADTRAAFMLCHIIPMMNSFIDAYKRDACGA